MKPITTNGNGRLELLLAREKQVHQALTAERLKLAKHEKRDLRKLDLLLGSAVRMAGAQSADFRRMIGQTALANITEERSRAFLKDRGWL